jgi:hypothetical protein
MEVLIAVSLLALLSTGMLFAIRTGLNTFEKANSRLMDNRRVAGAQALLTQQFQGMIPVTAPCEAAPGAPGIVFFQGEQQTMRIVSAFSLSQAWRGTPQILEFAVIPGAEGVGFRLIVNELPYTGPQSAGRLCVGFGAPDPVTSAAPPVFAPVQPNPHSFVLADKLKYCRFEYLTPAVSGGLLAWRETWAGRGWPRALRVQMAPLEPDPARVQPISVTVPIQIFRNPEVLYAD